MNKFKRLAEFKKEELLFDEEETLIILKFIFKPVDHALIDSLPMTDHLRGFAQGLLVEAIDASYAVGYVHGLFSSTTNPTKGTIKIIKSFAKKAAMHWFKHASAHDLQDVKIYDFVKDSLARVFRIRLRDFKTGTKLDKPLIANLVYKTPGHGIIKRWG